MSIILLYFLATEVSRNVPGPKHELSSQRGATTSTDPSPPSVGDSRDDQVSNEIETSENTNEGGSRGEYHSELLERIKEILKNRVNQGDTADADENTEQEEPAADSETTGVNMTPPSSSTSQVTEPAIDDVPMEIPESKNYGSEQKIRGEGEPKKDVFFCNNCHIHVVELYNLFKHFCEVHSQYVCIHCLQIYNDATILTSHLESAHRPKALQTVSAQSWEGFIRSFNGPVYVVCGTCGGCLEYVD